MHSLVLGFLNIGSSEMVLIVFVALLLFGGEKLPEIARGLGKGIRDFKDASEGVKREINNQINSYEEKREETKLNEQAAEHEAAQKELPSYPEGFTPVENTIPVNDSHLTTSDSPVAEEHKEVATETVAEKHTIDFTKHEPVTHSEVSEHETPEITKNTK
ncbi:twin-arginine translocase TatA/TatE family subunit [Mucilaginibacter sp. OK098]|uniref:Sec-independent protein translocase subunit TatA/TatB n=1 Tax=Mucilaginibacter sp. OK098 TaxID=1855297 RepID=UPI00092357D5|nr:twin-arginine translocase TatA/TatE family subunit [Mucilaginibacter sp. OK098]SHN16928.1 twin arginine-targeting protein translocase, TatA/E family [Mucilaginibacter sp. OK098]